MGDGQRRAPARKLAQRGEDFLFRAGIERAGRLVQQQDRRVLQERPGNRHALFLPARKLQSAFAHFGIEALRQHLDERQDRCTRRCRAHFFLARAFAAISDVVADGVVEQHAVLRDDADGAAQGLLGDGGDILPVDQDAPGPRIVEAEQQPGDGGLARARRADDGGAGSGGDFEAEAVQDLPVAVIAEADVVEHHAGPLHQQSGRVGTVLHFHRRIHQPEHVGHVDQALPDRAIDPAEHVERAEQLHQIGVDQHQIAGRQRALAPLPHGPAHGEAHQQVHQQRLRDVQPAERVFAADGGFGILPGRAGIAVQLAPFRAEIFHRLVIQQRIDRAGQRQPVQIIHLAAQFGAPFGDDAGHPDIQHHRQRGGGHDLPAEFGPEDRRHQCQFDQRR